MMIIGQFIAGILLTIIGGLFVAGVLRIISGGDMKTGQTTARPPDCPCCHKSDRVVKSDHPDYGEFFCPCNEPGPQYFNHDGSGTLLTTNESGKPIAVYVDFEGGMHFRL